MFPVRTSTIPSLSIRSLINSPSSADRRNRLLPPPDRHRRTHSLALPPRLAAGSISWFPDSAHLIAALSGPGQPSSLWEISTLGGNPRKLIDDGRSPEVSPDGKQIAYITGAADNKSLWATTGGDDENTLLNVDLQGHWMVERTDH